jgi:tRNA(Ile)-lysidine synthase
MEKIARKFYEQIKQTGLPAKSDKVLVGVSGGPDSTALLHLLQQVSHPFSFHLGIAHINHSLRGENSLQDALFVKELAMHYNLPFYQYTCSEQDYKSIPGSGIEEKARNQRKAFFQKIRETHSYHLIALGHNADDLLETMLFNLIRGTSPEVLSEVMPAYDPVQKLIRPLLSFSKQSLLSYLTACKINYRLDATNLEANFSRNKIRNLILPLFREINPKSEESILRFQTILFHDLTFLKEVTNQFLSKDTVTKSKDAFQIQRNEFLNLPTSIQLRCIREIRKRLVGSCTDFYFSQIISIHMGIIYTKNYCYKDKCVHIKCSGDWIVFEKGKV